MSNPAKASTARTVFNQISNYRPKSPRTRPIPIRFTESEVAYLRKKAGKLPLSTYMRQELLGPKGKDKDRKQRQPNVNQKEISALLASLGQSRLPSNLNQLAKAVNMGTLDVSRDTEQQLLEASEAVLAMRNALFIALGLKPED